MKREIRLTRKEDFRRVYAGGKRAYGKYIIIHCLLVQSRTKIGISVSKKIGNAVKRNLVKRRLRAIIGRRINCLPANTYIVISAKTKSKYANYQQLEQDLENTLQVLRIEG